MHLALYFFFFNIYIYYILYIRNYSRPCLYTRLYYIIQETRRRIHRYDIFSALLWPVWNHIPKVLYICLYVRVRERVPCTEIPAPLSIFLSSLYHLTHHSIISSLRLFSRCSLDHHRTDRSYTYDRRSLSLFLSIYILSSSHTCPSEWSLRECVTPSLELYAFDQRGDNYRHDS